MKSGEQLLLHIASRIKVLSDQRTLMENYLKLRQELGDMHGVMDASADIREIDARLSELYLLQSTLLTS